MVILVSSSSHLSHISALVLIDSGLCWLFSPDADGSLWEGQKCDGDGQHYLSYCPQRSESALLPAITYKTPEDFIGLAWVMAPTLIWRLQSGVQGTVAAHQNYLVSSSSPKEMRTGCLLFPMKGMQNTRQTKTTVSHIFTVNIFATAVLPHNQLALRRFLP